MCYENDKLLSTVDINTDGVLENTKIFYSLCYRAHNIDILPNRQSKKVDSVNSANQYDIFLLPKEIIVSI